jgi:hypothetical protein
MNGRLEKMKIKDIASTNALLGGALLAMAGFSAPVHAIKITVVENIDAMGVMAITEAMNHVSYAKETLLKAEANTQAATDKSDTTTYYKVVPTHRVFFNTKLGRNVNTQTLNVVVTLDGMVFSGDAELATTTDRGTDASREGDAGASRGLWILTGSMINDATLFRLDALLAVSEGGGSINVAVSDPGFTVPGFDSAENHPITNAVRLATALQETVELPAKSPEAKVDVGFMGFGGTTRNLTKAASLGTIKLGVKPDLRNAQSPFVPGGGSDIVTALHSDAGVSGITVAEEATTTATENPVTIAGTTSFIGQKGKFGLVATPATPGDCSSIEDIRKTSATSPSMILDEIKGQMAITFIMEQTLCVMVDGETVIPETGAYTVETSYKGLANAAFPPAGGTHALAAIGRNGTTFRIPYITTDAGYNQRFVIVNRGAATTYSFGEFEVEEARGVMVAAGMDASGGLPQGTTVLRAEDVVDITGGSRVAGTLTIVADDSTIDAAVQQVNLENRTVDTVYLTSR